MSASVETEYYGDCPACGTGTDALTEAAAAAWADRHNKEYHA